VQEGSTHVGGGGGRGDANKLRFSQADKRGGEARGSPGEGATVRIARMWTCAQAALATDVAGIVRYRLRVRT
jgi:hypothetical protein